MQAGTPYQTPRQIDYDYEIVRAFPNYFLDYQERMDESTRWTDRLNSGTGD